ncbi:MAG: Molybdopterin synthase catalytic subunit [Pycnora praestabilis]|nr:MAG: Molybdopterin synthase catalytic subunit [Pycnora praestabilis]
MELETPPPQRLEEPNIHVELTHAHLDVISVMNRVKSPKAGAVVLFAGTTRDSFDNKPVSSLNYSSYPPLALNTLMSIAKAIHTKYALVAISLTHRLGTVPIGEESILIAVSAPHRQAAWKAGEEALEECKERVEVWKLEKFGGEEGGVWRANRDGGVGIKVEDGKSDV